MTTVGAWGPGTEAAVGAGEGVQLDVRRVAGEVFTRLAAVVAILAVLPLLVLIAVAVAVSSPGPVLFRQRRVGRDGRAFTIVKFRTMCVDAEARLEELRAFNEHDGVLFKLRRDPRVTSVGRVLRRLSMDELPQLWNVLRGDMAFVGPRPALPDEVAQYDAVTRRRLLVKPGLTGLWQVSGRSLLSWEESVNLDLHYVFHRSVWLNASIVLRTLTAVLTGRGAF